MLLKVKKALDLEDFNSMVTSFTCPWYILCFHLSPLTLSQFHDVSMVYEASAFFLSTVDGASLSHRNFSLSCRYRKNN